MLLVSRLLNEDAGARHQLDILNFPVLPFQLEVCVNGQVQCVQETVGEKCLEFTIHIAIEVQSLQ